MERFDVLDRLGRPTGLVLPKGAVLDPGQFFMGVHIYVYNSVYNFLIQRRALGKSFRPGQWDILMGHAMAGEGPEDAALRELYEEVGLIPGPQSLRRLGRVTWDEEHHFIDVYFCLCEFDPARLTLQAEEVMDAAAIPRAQMLRMVDTFDYRPEVYRDLVRAELNRMGGA